MQTFSTSMGGVACSCEARQDTQLHEQQVFHEPSRSSRLHEGRVEAEQLVQLHSPLSPALVKLDASMDTRLHEKRDDTAQPTHLSEATAIQEALLPPLVLPAKPLNAESACEASELEESISTGDGISVGTSADGQDSLSIMSQGLRDAALEDGASEDLACEVGGPPSLSRLRVTPSMGREVRANTEFTHVDTDVVSSSFRLASRTEPLQGPDWVAECLQDDKHKFCICFDGSIRLKQPVGDMDFFLGGELDQDGGAQPMSIGWATRGACNVILRLLQAWEPRLHYSFGDASSGERPHISLPFDPKSAWMKNNLEVSEWPSGKAVPRSDWPEGMQPGFTYSINMRNMYFDLENWQLASIPMLGSSPLRRYWGESAMRMVLYARPREQRGAHIPATTTRLLDARIDRAPKEAA